MRENKIPFTSNDNAIENENVIAFYQELIDSFNKFFNQVEQVKKFVLLPNEWTIDGGELTPTLKLKRKAIMEKYKAFYRAIYQQ
jgi:long-chain acyl-CoA synthetase